MRVFLIPEKVRYYMIQKNFNSLDISKCLNIAPANFSKYVNANNKIDISKANILAEILQVSVNEIIKNDDKIEQTSINEYINDDSYLKKKLLDLWNKIDNETDKLILLVKISKFIESRKKND